MENEGKKQYQKRESIRPVIGKDGKQKRDQWDILLYLGKDEKGKYRTKWVRFTGTKTDARKELTRLENERNQGTYIAPSKLTFAEYLERWLADYARAKCSPKTCEVYEGYITGRIIPALGRYELSKLTALHIQKFYTDCQTSERKRGQGQITAQTIVHLHRIIHKALACAVDWDIIQRNPADKATPPEVEQTEMRALNAEQTASLIRAAEGTRFHIPVVLAVLCGLRRGEVFGLTWEDVNLDAGTATVRHSQEQTSGRRLRQKQPKTSGSKRTIALPGAVIEALREHRRQQARIAGPIIAQADGSPWLPDSFSQAFKQWVKRLDLPPITFHELRHRHASQLIQAGVHAKTISSRLGHSGIAITMDLYGHLFDGVDAEAAQKVDEALRKAMGER